MTKRAAGHPTSRGTSDDLRGFRAQPNAGRSRAGRPLAFYPRMYGRRHEMDFLEYFTYWCKCVGLLLLMFWIIVALLRRVAN